MKRLIITVIAILAVLWIADRIDILDAEEE